MNIKTPIYWILFCIAAIFAILIIHFYKNSGIVLLIEYCVAQTFVNSIFLNFKK